MRNIYDQYEQPENRLTHALACTLSNRRGLIRPFLKWLRIRDVPPLRELRLVEQQLPEVTDWGDGARAESLPDACITTADGWAVLFEAKVQAGVNIGQLERHIATLRRYGYKPLHVVLITVDPPRGLPAGVRKVAWQAVYKWFRDRADGSVWVKAFIEYMQVFESKMLAQDYGIRGTLTMFDGLRFDEDNPYNYREAKRLLRLMGDELQGLKKLARLGVDPKGERRPAITGRDSDFIWDFLPLKAARRARLFTKYPHLTIGLGEWNATAAVTIPNGVRGGFRSKLKACGLDGFRTLLLHVHDRLRPVMKRCPGASSSFYLLQRHYTNQSSPSVRDALMYADLRSLLRRGGAGVKYQPEWVDAAHALLCHKRSNMQFGIEMYFPYDAAPVRSRRIIGLFADSWVAMKPVLDFVLED